MSWSLRRAVLTVGPVILFWTTTLLVVGAKPVQLQVQPIQKGPGLPGVKPVDPTENQQAIELPKNPDASKKLEAAGDYIKDEDWVTATKILQDLLEHKENYQTKVVRKAEDGKETVIWVSIKSEADRLVATLPKDGKEFYQITYGPVAAQMLKDAKATSNADMLTDVTRRFLHTDAGAEATNLLATRCLDHGEYTMAALCYAKLLSRDGADKLSANTLARAYFAFVNAGDVANAANCLQKLNTFQSDLRFGTKTVTVEELQQYVKANGRSKTDFINYDTMCVGGNASRTGQSPGGPVFFEPNWKIPLIRTAEVEAWIKQVETTMKDRGLPLIPAMQPITATVMHNDQKMSLVVFRSHWGIHAVDMKNPTKVKWETPCTYSLDRMVRDTKKVGFVNQCVASELATRPNMLVENSTVGTLSTDGAYVFMIEDIEVPPANQFQQNFGNPNIQPNFGDKAITGAVNASKLMAFDLVTGKLKWEIGGPTPENKDEKIELADSYFLGAPLPLGGKLYVLTERQQELRLACIDPSTGKLLPNGRPADAGHGTRRRCMMDVRRGVRGDASRLTAKASWSARPTPGAILGVDLLSNSLVWAYPYRQKDGETTPDVVDPRFGRGRGGIGVQPGPGFVMGPDGRWYNPDLNTKWKVSPPVVVDGKVVFTAPDANAIHCISLRDGAAIWHQARQPDDLYFAGVFSGKAVIVGKSYVKALSLAKGDEVWRVSTGTPSGYGVASDNIYYVPLKESFQGKEPEICAIDVDNGKIVAHTKTRKKGDRDIIPGNLLFFEGEVLSQNATEMAAYPQLKVQLAKIEEALQKDPNNAEGRFLRGQLLLDKGDLTGAITDLRLSMQNKPSEATLQKAREKLYDSFTELFQRDFNKAEEFLKEYEELCTIPVAPTETDAVKAQKLAEQRRRRANFLCLVAKGKEAQGKLVEAFQRYQEFAAEAAKYAAESNEKGEELKMISVVDEPTVKARPEVWSGGRIAAMFAKATPEERKPLEEMMTKKWDELKKTQDINEIRNFVRVFGSLFTVGKEARLELANRLMDDNSPLALLEAEQHLTLLRVRGEDPSMSGRAVEALARLNTRKGLVKRRLVLLSFAPR